MAPARGTLRVVDDGAALAKAGADLVAEAAADTGERFVIGLAGGSTPRPLYEMLATPAYRGRIDWSRAEIVLGDERFVDPEDPVRNFRMIRTALLDHVPVPERQKHAVPFQGLDVAQAAERYELTLKNLYGAQEIEPGRPLFDICLLGMGDDGHTASLLPGQDALLGERRRWVLPVTEGRPEKRVTLTLPVLDSARLVVFLVSGEGKRGMLESILSGAETDVPASRVRPEGRLIWLADRAAAGGFAA